MPRFEDLAAEGQALVEVGGQVVGVDVATQAELDAVDAAKAPLESPALTGTPTVPTAPAGTNTTQAASTAFVKGAVDSATSATVSFVDALRFGAQAGTRTIVTTMGVPSLTLPDAATTVLTALAHVPEGWTTYNLHEWHYNPAATTDVVTLLRRVYPVTSGTVLDLAVLPTGTGSYDSPATSFTPGAQNAPIRTLVTSGLTIPASRKVLLYQRRNGSADTSAVSLQFVGYELVKAS